MAGPDFDPRKALNYKEKGNQCFQKGDYAGAEELYTKAIDHDPRNPLFYTNRAMASLKLSPPKYTRVAADCRISIDLLPKNLKGYFFLAQAQIELKMEEAALASAKEAHKLCVEECMMVPMGKGASNIEKITELVLRCKKEWWEEHERERVRVRGGLLTELTTIMENNRESGMSGDSQQWDAKIRELASVFEMAKIGGEDARQRKVPEWAIDNITFSVMLDPVITKNGQSYDRSSIIEHLKRSSTDPLTREPLRIEDLRPNRALREACAEFLAENGWAVDW